MKNIATADVDCKHPQSEIYENHNLGVTACGACGKVITENELRVETSFPAQSQGASIPRFRPIHRSISLVENPSVGELSRACMESVHKDLINLSHRVRTSESVVNTAQRLYAMLVERGMNTAVERRVTLGVCLYIACRLEKTNHVISQFVHSVGTNISVFNALFVRISHALELGLHTASPESYLETLVGHLELGPASSEIITRAEEVLEKMHEEWIDYGRFPFGVVAAAVLIACQMTGHAQQLDKLSEMVMMTNSTLLSRLREFSKANFLLDTGENDDIKAPPVFVKQSDTGYLLKRLDAYHLRLQGMRRTLLEMFSGSSQYRTPLCLSTWKSYWMTRLVACGLCQRITKRNIFTEDEPSFEEVKREMNRYSAPVYIPFPAPELDEDAAKVIRQEIIMLDSGSSQEISVPQVPPAKAAAPAPGQTTSLGAGEGEIASGVFLGAIDEEAHENAEYNWEMVRIDRQTFAEDVPDDCSTVCSDSTVLSRSSRVEIFPEIEYEEGIVNRRKAYIQDALDKKAKERARRVDSTQVLHTDTARLMSSLGKDSAPTDVSSRLTAASSIISRRSRRGKQSLVSRNADSPGHAVLSRLGKGIRSGFNKDALIELLDGKGEGIDVPSWNQSVIDLQYLQNLDNEPMS
ncbi:transcription factor [Perkinsela sp. CCAP 1560/4]|nr:transcription factor [Perkinsela sp. CCAP 1560/4]|eukprot:KNH06863.1 transcription factor [Perkinsela sp. CCAP 1560/4]